MVVTRVVSVKPDICFLACHECVCVCLYNMSVPVASIAWQFTGPACCFRPYDCSFPSRKRGKF